MVIPWNLSVISNPLTLLFLFNHILAVSADHKVTWPKTNHHSNQLNLSCHNICHWPKLFYRDNVTSFNFDDEQSKICIASITEILDLKYFQKPILTILQVPAQKSDPQFLNLDSNPIRIKQEKSTSHENKFHLVERLRNKQPKRREYWRKQKLELKQRPQEASCTISQNPQLTRALQLHNRTKP